MRKLILAIAIAAGMVVFAQSPAAATQTCSDAYASCSRVCSGGRFFGG